MKLLTIIIPTYNMSAYLDRCLTSLHLPDAGLMEQLEVLVIDDGSTDDSLSIAQRHVSLCPNSIRAIHKENGNYGSCINRGLAEAAGQYVKVVDADDWVNTENLAEMMLVLSTTQVNAILTDHRHIEPSGKERFYVSLPIKANCVLQLDSLSDEAMRSVMMHAVAYRTDMLRNISYRQTEGISYTDQEWVFLPMAQAQTVYYLPQPVYHYLVGRSGQTVDLKVWERNFWMELQGMTVMLDEYIMWKERISDGARRYLQQRLAFRNYAIYEAYFTRFATGHNNELMKEYDQSLRQLNPTLWQLSAQYSIASFQYVKAWREAGYPPRMFRLKLHRLAASVLKSFSHNLHH